MPNIDRHDSKPPIKRDRRVKYNPELIRKQQDSLPARLGDRRSYVTDINGGQAMEAATGSIRELSKILTEIVSQDASLDEMLELPPEILLNIGNRSSRRVNFISDTPYRSKPADV